MPRTSVSQHFQYRGDRQDSGPWLGPASPADLWLWMGAVRRSSGHVQYTPLHLVKCGVLHEISFLCVVLSWCLHFV